VCVAGRRWNNKNRGGKNDNYPACVRVSVFEGAEIWEETPST
jgi:hypothetical protein